ncbi:MAG: hypothetical protein ACT4QG_07715 [Sporichthyaceae bacterium]
MALLQDTTAAAPATPAKARWISRHPVATAVVAALLGAAIATGGALVVSAAGDDGTVDQYGISTERLNSPDGDGERAARRILENAQ